MMNDNHMGMQALQGLNSMGSHMGDSESTSGVDTARQLLQQAASLHKAHMTGDAPVNEKSQQELMDLIEDALESLSQ